MDHLGVAIRRARNRKGWSIGRLARETELDGGYLSKLETGKVASPGIVTIEKIATVLEMSPDELLPSAARARTAMLSKPGDVIRVPVVNISLAAGNTVYGETRETVPIPAELVVGRSLVAARVAGDCMEPEIMAGDVAIVDISDRSPRPGHLVAVLLEDGGMAVKRVSKDDEGPVLLDNKGGRYRPNGATVQGTIVSVVRNYR